MAAIGDLGPDRLLGRYRAIERDLSPQLDALRGLSAIVVLVAHCYQVFIAPEYQGAYPVLGLMAQASVMVFFALSGFLITKSITRNYCDGGFNLRSYAVDRLDRIYPPFLTSMLLLIAVVATAPFVFPSGTGDFLRPEAFLARQGLHLDWIELAGALIFLNGFLTAGPDANGPLWSLSFEVWYYVAAGLIAWQRGRGVILALALMAALSALNRPFAVYSVVWFAGAAVALLHNHEKDLRGYARAGAMIMGAVASVVATAYIWHFAETGSVNGRLIVVYNASIGLAFACLLHLLSLRDWAFRPVASGSAGFSYTLYVIHFPLLLFIYGAAQEWILGSALRAGAFGCLAAAISLASAMYIAKAVEARRPLKRLAQVPAE